MLLAMLLVGGSSCAMLASARSLDKILMATLGDFSVYFVLSKVLILAYFWVTNEEVTNFFI